MQDSEAFTHLIPHAAEPLADLLGLSRFIEAGCRIVNVEKAGKALRLIFEFAGVGSGSITLLPENGESSFLSTGRIAVRFSGSDVARPWAVLMARIAASLGDMDFDALMAVAEGPKADVFDDALTRKQPYNPILSWGADDGWRQFMCDAAMERRFNEAFEFDTDSSFIVHGDLECRFVAPGARVRLPGHFVYPFDLFSHNEAVGPVTELDDRDVIVDSTVKMERKVLREISDRSSRGPVVIVSTCVPVIVAEDPTNALERLNAACPEGVRYVTPISPVSPSEIFMQSFSGLRQEVLAQPPQPATVGLVGYRPGRSMNELRELLASVGVTVTGGIVPLVTRKLLRATLAAKTIVLAPSRYHQTMYENLVDGAEACGRRKIVPAYPWGIDATANWLVEVAGACGMTADARKIAARLAADARRRVDEARVSDSVFMIVCEPGEYGRLVDPVSPAGLPVLSFLRGLGLRTRVAVHVDNDNADAASAGLEKIVDSTPGTGGVEFTPFHSERELNSLLCSTDVAAVYSEMFFDYRATRNGIPVFSSRAFEPGFDGAVRTIQRLNRLAGLPFYRRYISGC